MRSRAGRSGLLLLIALVASLLPLGASAVEEAPSELPPIRIETHLVASGLDQPVFVTHGGDGSGRLFVAEKAGRIKSILPDGTVAAEPFLDIVDRVKSDSLDQGLLGLTFHPAFEDNGRFYVAYTRQPDGALVISELLAGETAGDAASERAILIVPQPGGDLHGGMLAFDHTGRLLVSTGDGSFFPTERGNARDPDTLLGKLLRLDVDAAPRPSPEVGPTASAGADGVADGLGIEMLAMGLRNPWRYSVDRQSGDIYIADVGLWTWEEVDLLRPGSPLVDFGWPEVEGPQCGQAAACDLTASTPPVMAYPHEPHASVIGGYAYHGTAEPLLQGRYVFGDYSHGSIMVADVADMVAGSAVPAVALTLVPGDVASFGEDEEGELYVVGSSSISRLSAVLAPPEPDRAADELVYGFPVVTTEVQGIADLIVEPAGEGGVVAMPPEIFYTNEVELVETAEGCLLARPTGSDPYFGLAVPDGMRLRVQPATTGLLQIFLETDAGITEEHSRFVELAPLAYDVYLPPQPVARTTVLRIDPPSATETELCLVAFSDEATDVAVVSLELTSDMKIKRDGEQVTEIPVRPGQEVLFRVTNTAGYEHNLFIGPDELLATNETSGLPGVPDFTEGVRQFTWQVPEDVDGLRFGCTVPGHYALMQGDIVIES